MLSEDSKKDIDLEVKYSSKQESKKSLHKVNFVLTDDAYKKLTELSSKRLLEVGRTDKSLLICDAIDLLYREMMK